MYAALSEYASKAGLGCQEGVTANVEEQSPPRIRGQGRAGQGRAQGSEKRRKVGNGKWVIETSDDGAGGHTTFRELVPGHCGCRSPGLLWPVRGEPACSEYR